MITEQQEKAGAVAAKRARPEWVGETPRQQARRATSTTRRQLTAEEKVRIVTEGMGGVEPGAEARGVRTPRMVLLG